MDGVGWRGACGGGRLNLCSSMIVSPKWFSKTHLFKDEEFRTAEMSEQQDLILANF